MVISGCPFRCWPLAGLPVGRLLPRGRAGGGQEPDDECAHHVPLVLRAAAVVGPGPRGLCGQVGCGLDDLGGERLAGECLDRLGARDGGPADPGQGDAALVTVSPEVSTATATPTV